MTSQADRVLKINAPDPNLQHIELETGHHGAESAENLLRFSVLVSRKYRLPVESALILLRKEADRPALTGRLQYHRRSGEAYLSFEYTVVRLWELPVEALLTGGLGTLPLAPLANVREDQLPAIVRQMRKRLDLESPTNAEEGEFWTATNVLMGLRYPDSLTFELLKGVRRMQESVTYQAILREGEAKGRLEGEAIGRSEGRSEEARSVILRLGQKRFGDASEAIQSAIDAVPSVDRLEQLIERILEVESWDELLADS